MVFINILSQLFLLFKNADDIVDVSTIMMVRYTVSIMWIYVKYVVYEIHGVLDIN